MKSTRLAVCIVALWCAAIGLWGCPQGADWAGTYVAGAANDRDSAPLPTQTLELLPDGRGTWTLDSEALTFRWQWQAGKIRFHTDTGTVLVAACGEGREIRLDLPDLGPVAFHRLPD